MNKEVFKAIQDKWLSLKDRIWMDELQEWAWGDKERKAYEIGFEAGIYFALQNLETTSIAGSKDEV